MDDDRGAALYRATCFCGNFTQRSRDNQDGARAPADPLRKLRPGSVLLPSLGQSLDPELRDEGARRHLEEVQVREMQERLVTYEEAEKLREIFDKIEVSSAEDYETLDEETGEILHR